MERTYLLHGIKLPTPPVAAPEPLVVARELLPEPPRHQGDDHIYPLPENAAGQAKQRRTKSSVVRQIFPAPIPSAALSRPSTTTDECPPVAGNEIVVIFPEDPTVGGYVEATTPSITSVPQSTTYKRNRYALLGKETNNKRMKELTCCRKCGKLNLKQTGHRKHSNFVFCPNVR